MPIVTDLQKISWRNQSASLGKRKNPRSPSTGEDWNLAWRREGTYFQKAWVERQLSPNEGGVTRGPLCRPLQ